MQARRMRTPSILSIAAEDVEPILWQKVCSAMSAPGPISALHFSAYSDDKFAFSTLDGSLHFASICDRQLRAIGCLCDPNVSFLKFQWISDSLILGFGVSQAAFVLAGDSRIFEIPLPAPPSEIAKYPTSAALALIGSQSGHVMCCDISEFFSGGFSLLREGAVTISKVECDVIKFHNAKKMISALAAGPDFILCGTSDGDIDILTTELKTSKKKGKFVSEVKVKSVSRISAVKFTESVRNASVDSLSVLRINETDLLMFNTRNEEAALLASKEKYMNVIHNYRIPSLRAKCPCALNSVDGEWLWICGSDMGDLIVCEEGQEPVILTMHEEAIVSVEWIKGTKMFLAADVSGLVSFWKKMDSDPGRAGIPPSKLSESP
jgi:hypothetical protein